MLSVSLTTCTPLWHAEKSWQACCAWLWLLSWLEHKCLVEGFNEPFFLVIVAPFSTIKVLYYLFLSFIILHMTVRYLSINKAHNVCCTDLRFTSLQVKDVSNKVNCWTTVSDRTDWQLRPAGRMWIHLGACLLKEGVDFSTVAYIMVSYVFKIFNVSCSIFKSRMCFDSLKQVKTVNSNEH